MVFIIFLKWWYGPGWASAFKSILLRTDTLAKDLSIPILLRTLFEPWKQINLNTGQNASLDLKMHVLAENLFSRFFGFFIRLFVIVFGLLAMLCVTFFGLILALLWPAVPFLPVILIFMAVISL
jgi:hypothetical protein